MPAARTAIRWVAGRVVERFAMEHLRVAVFRLEIYSDYTPNRTFVKGGVFHPHQQLEVDAALHAAPSTGMLNSRWVELVPESEDGC